MNTKNAGKPREKSAMWKPTVRVARGFLKNNCDGRAVKIAFFSLFALFPCLLSLTSLLAGRNFWGQWGQASKLTSIACSRCDHLFSELLKYPVCGQPMENLFAETGTMPAPGVFLRGFYHASPYRIEVNVAYQFQKIIIS